jgi:cysteinyl-tRNA synthetase
MTVSGNGLVSVRRRGTTATFAAGESLGLDELSALLRGERAAGGPGAPAGVPEKTAEPVLTDEPAALSLRAEADRARTAFEAALAARDADGCVAAVLGLEQAIADWQSDTLQSDDADEARRVLRALVVRLGELAERGAADPAVGVAPFVEALIDVRRVARDNKDFGTSDLVRDRLVAAGVEVHDTPDGTEWTLTS